LSRRQGRAYARSLFAPERPDAIEQEIAVADAVIGAVLVPGTSAPKLVSRPMLKAMRPNSVIVDVAVDQGGCFETSRPTTHENPTYYIDRIICVANMLGAVPLTSSHALNNATLPFGLQLADRGLAALIENPYLRAGLNVHRGAITHQAVAEALDLTYKAAEQALAA
jgi:alanine dehydrogenase